jgi:hypothetical protein
MWIMGADGILGHALPAGCLPPFKWIDGVMEDVACWLGRMLDNEAACEPDGEETEKHGLKDLRKKYPWWLSGCKGEESATIPEKAESGDTVTLFEGRNTRM